MSAFSPAAQHALADFTTAVDKAVDALEGDTEDIVSVEIALVVGDREIFFERVLGQIQMHSIVET